LTVQGNLYTGKIDENLAGAAVPTPPFSTMLNNDLNTSGGNVLARWQRRFSGLSEMAVQLYYDRTDRDEKVFREIRDTLDLDFQHQFTLGKRHAIVWGLGYRVTRDDFNGGFIVALDPKSRSDNLFSAFVQDDITLVENRLRLTLGSKFEHNDYTGFEYQPNVRLLWTPQARHTVWAAVSRAVRTPARQQDDIRLRITALPPGTPANPGPLPTFITTTGNRGSDSEELLAFDSAIASNP